MIHPISSLLSLQGFWSFILILYYYVTFIDHHFNHFSKQDIAIRRLHFITDISPKYFQHLYFNR